MKIALHPFERSDIPRLLNWIKTEEELIQWSGPFFKHPLNQEQLESYYETGQQSPPIRKIFKTVDLDAGKIIGHIELNNIDWRNLAASVSKVLIGEPAYRGLGICTIMTDLLLEIAFVETGLHRMYLNVFDFNLPAVHCYEKSGFIKEGLVRHYRKVGNEYWNSYLMSILEPEWRLRRSLPADTIKK